MCPRVDQINVPEEVFYYFLGNFILNQKENEGFKRIDNEKRELLKLFIGYIVMVNLINNTQKK